MSPDLLQSLQIFSQLVVQAVSEDLTQDKDTTAITSELTHFSLNLDETNEFGAHFTEQESGKLILPFRIK